MSTIVFFDAPHTDDTVDLDDQLRAQFGPFERVTSMPLHTTIVGEVAVTIIRVTHKGRARHQVYSVTDDTWALVAVFGCYTDALSELLRWRRYLGQGGTVAEWQAAHPDGVYPERSGL
jgi:hypothetical protein